MTETPDYVPGRFQQSSRPLPANANCRDHPGYKAARCPICSHEIRTRQRSPQQRGQRIRTIVTPPAGLLEGLRRQDDQKGRYDSTAEPQQHQPADRTETA